MTNEQIIFTNKLTIQLITSKRLKADLKRLSNRFNVDEQIVPDTINMLVKQKYLRNINGYLKLSKEIKKELGIVKENKVVLDGFTPPTGKEVVDHLLEKLEISESVAEEVSEYFVSYYEDRDWKWGKQDRPVKNWKRLLSRSLRWQVIKDMIGQVESDQDSFYTKFEG